MVTVLFASVLFFAGISAKMRTWRARIMLLSGGAVVFLGGVVALAMLPIQL